MNAGNLDKLLHADEGNFYDSRSMNFEKDKVAAVDDYGLSRVPAKWRFSAWQAFWSMSGLSTSMAIPLTGALLTLAFGAPAVIIGFLITAIVVGVGVYYTAVKSANEGIGKDLMSRASLGYFGSIFISLFTAFFLILLFALESSVMAHSLSEYVPVLPYWASATIITAVFVPIGIYGMVWINKLQNFTLWLYVIGIILVFVALFNGWSDKASASFAGEWWKINVSGAPLSFTTILAATGSWLGAFGFITIFAITDVTRMVQRKEKKKGAWLSIVIGAVLDSLLFGLFGIILLASTNVTNPNPGVTFVWLLGPVGLLLVLITQLRVNVLNMYLGTLAIDSSVAQITQKGFLRSWLLVPFVIIGYIIMLSPGLLANFTTIASVAGAIFAAWVGAVLGENLLVRRRYGIPVWSEFRRAYLPAINWIGFAPMIFPAILGVVGVLGFLGDFIQAASVILTLIVSFLLPVVIANMLGKEKVVRQYFARVPEIAPNESDTMTCSITGETHHRSDFVLCPFHQNKWISSLACATESKCGKMCQKSSVSFGTSSQLNV